MPILPAFLQQGGRDRRISRIYDIRQTRGHSNDPINDPALDNGRARLEEVVL